MAVPVRLKRLPTEVVTRLRKPGTLWSVVALLLSIGPVTWWIAPWSDRHVKPWVEERLIAMPDALRDLVRYLLEHPWLIPVLVVTTVFVVMVIHAYISAGESLAAESPPASPPPVARSESPVEDNSNQLLRQILETLERMSPPVPTGVTGPVGAGGVPISELQGATGATGPAIQSALQDLTRQGKIVISGGNASLLIEPAKPDPNPPESPELIGPEPHDPEKDYTATPHHEVFGQGRFRRMTATLDDVGNGWDAGVHCVIAVPGNSKAIHAGGWLGLQNPRMRREVANHGCLTGARPAGRYVINWMSEPHRGFPAEVIASEVFELEETGPLSDWEASHYQMGERLKLAIRRKTEAGRLLRGFRCNIFGPSGQFLATDQFDPARAVKFRTPRSGGLFSFPTDFSEAPAIRDLHDGDYEVLWDAWPAADGDPAGTLDVAYDVFHVFRDGHVE